MFSKRDSAFPRNLSFPGLYFPNRPDLRKLLPAMEERVPEEPNREGQSQEENQVTENQVTEPQPVQPPKRTDRANDQLRPVSFINDIAPYATGSTLIQWGNTRVICAATVEDGVPRWMREQGVPGGWITAEYSMLPYSTQQRKPREISRGRPEGRSQEIQRLIGRAMRAAVDLQKLGQRTIWIDADVLQADGGTRTAAITGGYVALALAIRKLVAAGILEENPILSPVAAVSVGIVDGEPRLDLNYEEDVVAEVDMNIVMNGQGEFVEVQGTGERKTFTYDQLNRMLAMARQGIQQLIELQKQALVPQTESSA